MSKKFAAALLATMVTSAVIAAEGKGEKGDILYDIDNNGTLSQEEAKAIPGLTEEWARLDANQDGQLDAAEFAKFEVVDSRAPAN